jgi:hypothetical protein
MVIFGIGMGLFFPPVAYLILGAVPASAAGQASGANNAIREIGGVFGVGALTTIFATYGSYRSGVEFTDGLTPAVWVGTAIVGLGALIALLVPGRRQRVPEVVPTVVNVPEHTHSPLLSVNGPEPGTDAVQAEASSETVACPVCMGHGWFPFEPPQDPRTSTCPRCYGHGKVLTGSHVAAHTVRDCPDCEAKGYVEVSASYEPLQVTTPPDPEAWRRPWGGGEEDT